MASVGLREIPEVVDSTAQGLQARGRGYQPPKVFPVTPQKPWVNQFVAYLRCLVAMVICELANQCSRGNEEQAAFNARLDKRILEAQANLPGPSTSPALDRVCKGSRLPSGRSTNVLQSRWSVVAEYTADELPDDFEDNRRLKKAEQFVKRKAMKRN